METGDCHDSDMIYHETFDHFTCLVSQTYIGSTCLLDVSNATAIEPMQSDTVLVDMTCETKC